MTDCFKFSDINKEEGFLYSNYYWNKSKEENRCQHLNAVQTTQIIFGRVCKSLFCIDCRESMISICSACNEQCSEKKYDNDFDFEKLNRSMKEEEKNEKQIS